MVTGTYGGESIIDLDRGTPATPSGYFASLTAPRPAQALTRVARPGFTPA